MKKMLVGLLIPALSGCLTATAPKDVCWLMEYEGAPKTDRKGDFGIGRMSQVVVRTPYNDDEIVVLRANGSIAMDHYNRFAAQPSTFLKGVLSDAMCASGRFSSVVNAGSSVFSDSSVEVVVTRLALDCRQPGSRQAIASLILRVLQNGKIVAIGKGDGQADAADGNYGAAFSRAFSVAVDSAFSMLR